MRFETLSVFPQVFAPYLDESIMGRAQRKGILDFEAYDLRHWTHDRHNTVDDAPFGGGQGQSTWVWTSWDGAAQAGNPFDPFGATQPRKTPAEQKADAEKDLRTEIGVIAIKLVCLAVLSVFASVASGLFLYVAASIIYGLWKRLGSCLIAFFFPIALVGAPFLMLIAPRAGAVTFGLAIFFALAVLFDIVNMRNAVDVYLAARKAASSAK